MAHNPVRDTIAPFVLRLGTASIFLGDGFLKAIQGGSNWHPELPSALQAVIAWGELVGALALILGLFTRLAAFCLLILMLGAMITVSGPTFYIDIQTGPGAEKTMIRFVSYEYMLNFTLMIMCFTLILVGSGRIGLDTWLWRKRESKPS